MFPKPMQRYRIFLFPRKSLKFCNFWKKSSELAKMLFFFPGPVKKKTAFSDELVSTFKLFQGKKKQAVFFFRPLFGARKKKQKFSDLS